MEANNFLPDHVHVSRPIMLKLLLLRFVLRSQSHGGAIVAQRVQPHIHHVLGIARNGNTPLESAAADREIAQSALHKRNHLIAPRLRTDEVWVLLGVRQQLVSKCGKLEVIVFFAYGLGGSSALRAGSAGS